MIAAVMRTKYRREDLVNAAEYVLDEYVPEGLDEYEVAAYEVRHVRRAAIDKWTIFYRKVIRSTLCSVPVCRMVIGPYEQDMGTLSVIAITVCDWKLDQADNDELMDLSSQRRENLLKSVLATARELFGDKGRSRRRYRRNEGQRQEPTSESAWRTG